MDTCQALLSVSTRDSPRFLLFSLLDLQQKKQQAAISRQQQHMASAKMMNVTTAAAMIELVQDPHSVESVLAVMVVVSVSPSVHVYNIRKLPCFCASLLST